MSRSQNVIFQQIFDAVRSVPRGYCASPAHFTISSLPPEHQGADAEKKIRICFCSTSQQDDCLPSTIYYVDLLSDMVHENPIEWKPLLETTNISCSDSSLADELLKERMRAYTDGISEYTLHSKSTGSQLIYTFGGKFLANVTNVLQQTPPLQSNVLELSTGCLMPEMCPYNQDLVCFSDGTNLRVCQLSQPLAVPLQLTHCSGPGITAGFPTYIMQEEFDRYKGFWWRPVQSADGEYCILYEENDESQVPIVNLPDFAVNQPDSTSSANHFRFPRPGEANSVSNLKLVRLRVGNQSTQTTSVVVEELSHSLMSILPEYEYLVRCGWTACGAYVWCYMLTRLQDKASLFAIPIESFQSPSSSNSHTSRLICLFTRQCDTDNWISVDDYFHVFSCEANGEQCTLDFLITSDHERFRHIYYVKRQCTLPLGKDSSSMVIESTSLEFKAVTKGDWEVTSETPMLDQTNHLVYFTARKEHPLMDHVYVQSYLHPRDTPTLLTRDTSLSYSIDMNAALNKMVLSHSNHSSCGGVEIVSIVLPCKTMSSTDATLDLSAITLTHCAVLHPLVKHADLFPNFPPPTLHEFEINEENMLKTTMYGLLFLPSTDPPSERGYPCLHYIYGGPGVQMISGDYPRHLYRFAYQCTTRGYAVFVCDGPGSKNRGNEFAKVIKYNMGYTELLYQVRFLRHVVSSAPIDSSRLAIHGWSYGGYMALMAMAHFKETYRLGVAGGSVTQWELYDTGYTERFLGLPEEHDEAYINGNVLNCAYLLPDERHRLLLVHGGKDENVHIFHVTTLMECMTALNKPYDFLLYPTGRHRIRMKDHLVSSIVAYLEENL